MPSIRPISDLSSSITDIAELAHSEREPVFITKDGYADLVVMSMETYEMSLARLEVYDRLAESQCEVESGVRLTPIDEVFDKYIARYGADSDEGI